MSKKTFKSVATTFFSTATKETPKPAQQVKASKAKAGQSAKAVQRETPPAEKPAALEVKARRVQLLMKPSTYELAKEAAYQKRLSFNEYIHLLIEEHSK